MNLECINKTFIFFQLLKYQLDFAFLEIEKRNRGYMRH